MSQGLDSIEPVDWDPLEPGEDFRVMILEAGSGAEPLVTQLKCVSFEALFNKYFAISYRWSDGSSNETITCNGYTVPISKNLYSALWRLRQPAKAINVWCDALCINQGTDDASFLEREQQVPLMGRIYGNAVRVIIDLGDDDGTLGKAVEGINAIVLTPQNLRRRCHLEADPTSYLKLPPFTDTMWDALEAFFSRPWFQRIWCVQEAVLARDIRVMFGSHAITIEALVVAATIYATVSQSAARTYQTRTWSMAKFSAPRFATMCILAMWQMRKARLELAEKYSVSLCQLMISTMAQHTTDRRDRVYALYGMLDPTVVADLPVNYAESAAELGVRLSEYFLRNKNGIWMLVHCCGLDSTQPSWTIDLHSLSARQISDPLSVSTRSDGTNPLYSAGQGPGKAEISLHLFPGCLEVQGVTVDVVECMAPMVTLPSSIYDGSDQRITPSLILKYIQWFVATFNWSKQFATEPNEAPDAFWRTLIANHNPHPDDPEREHNGLCRPDFETYFILLMTYAQTITNANIDFTNLTDDDFQTYYPVPPGAVKYWIAVIAPLSARRVIRTRDGRYGLVPENCGTGDVVAVFYDAPVPFVLRRDEDGEWFRFVGISYVHGIMGGEALRQGLLSRTFCLR